MCLYAETKLEILGGPKFGFDARMECREIARKKLPKAPNTNFGIFRPLGWSTEIGGQGTLLVCIKYPRAQISCASVCIGFALEFLERFDLRSLKLC